LADTVSCGQGSLLIDSDWTGSCKGGLP
jgi:hypothetical protein